MLSLLAFWMGGAGAPEQEPPGVDGSGLRYRRRKPEPVKPRDFYRTPEDIRREQLEEQRYLDSLTKPQQVPAKVTGGNDAGATSEPEAASATSPAAHPILADVAARAVSAVQAKFEEVSSAAALGLLAEQQQRRRVLVLLLALD